MNNEIADLVSEHESQLKMIAQDRADGIELVDEDYSVIIFTDTCGFVPSGNRNWQVARSGLSNQRTSDEETCANNTFSIDALFHRHHRCHKPRLFSRHAITSPYRRRSVASDCSSEKWTGTIPGRRRETMFWIFIGGKAQAYAWKLSGWLADCSGYPCLHP